MEEGRDTVNLIKEDVFRKQMKKGLSGGYLFFGDEDYLKSFSLTAAREAICPDPTFALFNDVRMDSLTYSAGALLDALMPPPMMCDQKIITVSGLNLNGLKSSEIEDLVEVLEMLPQYDYNVLILSVPAGQMDEGILPKRPSPLLTRLAEHLTPVQFEPISGARLAAWVGKHFQHHSVSASPEVCSYLIEQCGRSMFTLSAETEKLSYYVLQNGRTEVTRQDVELVSVSELSTDTFALANAIVDGRYEDAMQALNVMKFRRVEPVIILSEVSRAICDLTSIKALQCQGLPSSEICAVLKMNEYKARLYLAGAGNKSMKKLRRAVELCSEADLALKLSPQGYIAIERLIFSL